MTISEFQRKFLLRHDLSTFNRLNTAIWIIDIDNYKIWWGNKSALKFLEIDSLPSLVNQDFSAEEIFTREKLEEIFSDTSKGHYIEENWTLHLNQIPKKAVVTFIPLLIENEKRAILIEAIPQLTEETLQRDHRIQELTDKLTLTRQEIQSAIKSKSEFLTIMSHELRTPLNAILGFSDMLKQQVYGSVNEVQTSALNDIFNSGQHLLKLINELLDASIIDRGELQLVDEFFQFDSIIEDCQSIYKEEISKKNLSILVQNNAQLLFLIGDPDRFRQILMNIFKNAVQYTERNGTITFTIEYDTEGNLVFAIKDNGIGIAQNRLPNICKAFEQDNRSPLTSGKGMGLGLYITSQLVSAHGSKLVIESSEGEGTKVSFTLPKNRIRDSKRSEIQQLTLAIPNVHTCEA